MSLNPNPVVYAVKPTVKRRRHDNGDLLHDDLVTSVLVADAAAPGDVSGERDAIDSEEVFELIRHLADPEHPLTLEQLHVVRAEHVTVDVRRWRVSWPRLSPSVAPRAGRRKPRLCAVHADDPALLDGDADWFVFAGQVAPLAAGSLQDRRQDLPGHARFRSGQ